LPTIECSGAFNLGVNVHENIANNVTLYKNYNSYYPKSQNKQNSQTSMGSLSHFRVGYNSCNISKDLQENSNRNNTRIQFNISNQ
jgi:hypothetical protein